MGSINIDLIMHMEDMPIPGETIVTDNFFTSPGGKGGNQAAAAAALGGDVTYFTRLGDDTFSKDLTTELTSRGVSMEHVLYTEGDTAGIAMIRVDHTGTNSISFTPGANAKLSPEDVAEHEDLFAQHDILLITMEIQVETVYAAIRMAHKHNMAVILDPAPTPKDGIPSEIAKMVTYVKPNEIEAEGLTGIPVVDEASAEQAYAKLVEIGFQYPIITMSSKGVFTKENGSLLRVQPIKVNAIDTIAAGDIFLGSFATALSKGTPFSQCLHFANTVAGISTTKKGAQTSIPTLDEINIIL